MKKTIKILSFSILGLIVFVLLSAAIIPFVFKDKIKAMIDDVIAESVDANVYFDADKFGLSVFNNFPNITASLDDFGVVGKGQFEGDTLAAIEGFKIVIDIKSVLFEDQMKIREIYLNNPQINAIVDEDGKANWDIVIETDEEEIKPEEVSDPFSLAIEELIISNGKVIYDDRQGKMHAEIQGLNHISAYILHQVYDLETNTDIESLTFTMDGINYMSKSKISAKMDAIMDLDNMKFDFKENVFKINDFSFGFDGSIELPNDETTRFDITFGAKETEFKNILSLVPGVFLEGFEELKTTGLLAFDGFAKGDLNDNRIPAFQFNLQVADAMFQYPDLPTAVENIRMDFSASNEDGNIDNTLVDLKEFHMDMGTNPVDMRVRVAGLDVMDIDALVKTRLNLGDLNKMYSIEGLDMKGLFNLDLVAKGIYHEETQRLPNVEAAMKLENGFVKSADFPLPIENMFMLATANSDGNMVNTVFDVQEFRMVLDGEEFVSKLHLENFEDYTYNFSAKGIIDLDKMLKVFPLEDMTLNGRIDIKDFNTAGKMSYIDAEQYHKLPTSGKAVINNLYYADSDLPQGFKITQSEMSFTPDKILISSFEGFVGKSDIKADGYLNNYMGYIFGTGDTVLHGKMNFFSKDFDLNEWMEEEEVASTETEEIPLEVIEVPKDIDFVLVSSLDKVRYDNMDIENLKGDIIVKEGVVSMKRVKFNLLGGAFEMDGSYDTRDMGKPAFDYNMKINHMAVNKAFETFNTIQTLVPAAKHIDGDFSMDLKIAGLLGQDMMPVYNTLSGAGFALMNDGKVSELKSMNAVSSVLGFAGKAESANFKDINIKDTKVQFEIVEGNVIVKPFDLKAGNINMNIEGTNSLDGTIDYKTLLKIPGGMATQTLSSALGSYGSGIGNEIDVTVGLVGPATDPKAKILGSSAKNQAKDAVKQVITDKTDAAKDAAQQRLDEEKAKLDAQKADIQRKAEEERRKAEEAARKEAERIKKEAEEKAKREAEQRLKDEAKDKFKGVKIK